MRSKLSLLLASLLLLTSCMESQKNEESIRKVKWESVVSQTSETTSVTYPAKIYAAKDVKRSFRVAGVIEKIVVREGDFVKEGALLAQMDRRDYEIQLSATQAEYDAIKAEVERIEALYKDKSVSENDYDKAVNGLKMISAKLASHRNSLLDTELRAPFNGYIQKIHFDNGEAVSAGMPIISLISHSDLEVVVNIPTNEYMRRGDLKCATAKVELFGNEEFELQLIGTTHKSNLNQLHESRFKLIPSADKLPSPGMSTMVTLNYSLEESKELSVPFSSIFERDGRSYIYIIESSVATPREISVERILPNGRAIITGHVASGESVITAGLGRIKEGQRVEPLKEATKSNVGNIL